MSRPNKCEECWAIKGLGYKLQTLEESITYICLTVVNTKYKAVSCIAPRSAVETKLGSHSITRHNTKHNIQIHMSMKCALMRCVAFRNLMKDNIHRSVLHLPTGSTKLWLYSVTKQNGKHYIHCLAVAIMKYAPRHCTTFQNRI